MISTLASGGNKPARTPSHKTPRQTRLGSPCETRLPARNWPMGRLEVWTSLELGSQGDQAGTLLDPIGRVPWKIFRRAGTVQLPSHTDDATGSSSISSPCRPSRGVVEFSLLNVLFTSPVLVCAEGGIGASSRGVAVFTCMIGAGAQFLQMGVLGLPLAEVRMAGPCRPGHSGLFRCATAEPLGRSVRRWAVAQSSPM